MAISERTRKILWVTAGGRCSICRVQLVTDGTDTDDPSVSGEEAHIVAQARSGPRGDEVAAADSYDNLILLCRKDHKRIDDQVGYYTADRLRQIKRSHEDWIRSLGEVPDIEWIGSGLGSSRKELAFRAERIREQARLGQSFDEETFRRRYFASHPPSPSVRPGSVPRSDKPVVASGTNSKVVEIHLIRGVYRLNWTAEGRGLVSITHESGRDGAGRYVANGTAPEPGAGEVVFRVEESGRHILAVKADHLTWRLSFTAL